VEPIGLRLPGEPEPWFAAVLGCAGQEFGLYLAQGDAGLRLMRSWSDPARGLDAPGADALQIGFTLERWSALPAFQRDRLTRAGVRMRRESTAPLLMVVEGTEPRRLDPRLLRMLMLATAGVTAVVERHGRPAWRRPAPTWLPTFTISGKWREPQVETGSDDYGVPFRSTRDLDDDPSEYIPPASAPPEVQHWRSVAHSVIHRSMAVVRESVVLDDEALRVYFGHTPDLESDTFRHPELFPSFVEWAVRCVRPSATGQTVLEVLLDECESDDEAALIRARIAATPTLVAIDAVDAESGFVDGTDLLADERVRFHDEALSRSGAEGDILVASLVRVGDVILPELRGPGILPQHYDEACAYLEEVGLEISIEGFAAQPHLLGRLWEWRPSLSMPQINNTDGDPLVWHQLLLHADDSAGLEAALHEREDIDYDEAEGKFVWFIENDRVGSRAALGDHILLGGIRLIADEVLVTVNSRARADRARTWLEAVPGVSFVSMTTRPLDLDTEFPLDDRVSESEQAALASPELAEILADRLREYYVAWLDEPLPALDGNTPREAAHTKSGRARVRLLIRGIAAPNPGPGPGLDMTELRQALLRELGLD
jgi:hypothetical protein